VQLIFSVEFNEHTIARPDHQRYQTLHGDGQFEIARGCGMFDFNQKSIDSPQGSYVYVVDLWWWVPGRQPSDVGLA
jgi:hypothetical protein